VARKSNLTSKRRRRRRKPLGGWGFEAGARKLAGKCMIIEPKGQGRRRLCWDQRGKIKSNRPA